jgi:predicted metalloprotease with PDZ domain
VYSIAPEPPSDEIGRAGYRLVYNDKPNVFAAGRGGKSKPVFSWFDVGLQMSGKGQVRDVREGSPAWTAGLAPGMQIVAVNDRAFDPDLWTAAIADAKGTQQPLRLRVKQGGWYASMDIAYHDGLRYPHLERVAGAADMLAQIMRPHAGAAERRSR